MNERDALIVLNLVQGLGPRRARNLIRELGSAAAALEASPRDLERVEGMGPVLSRVLNAWRNLEYEKELELIARYSLETIPYDDPRYPKNLLEIYDPPVLLYCRGEPVPRDRFAVAVVGSRRASHYGLSIARRLGRELAERGLTVVSGLAFGVDAAAHEGALEGGGRTIAVLGSGLGNIYPREHRDLARRAAASGAVLSEFPVRFAPRPENFPARNRIISGLSLGTVVVEAAGRSGALITARTAMEQGRSVMAVPGQADNPLAEGTNSLIRDGARMVRTVEDILDEFEYLRAAAPGDSGSIPGEIRLSPEESAVMAALGPAAVGIEELIEKTGLTSSRLSAILLGLELKRMVRQLPGKNYLPYRS